jgi:hypothetical protein
MALWVGEQHISVAVWQFCSFFEGKCAVGDLARRRPRQKVALKNLAEVDHRRIGASRGYTVFQPQFRGSGGFGKRYVEAGYGQWGARHCSSCSTGPSATLRLRRRKPDSIRAAPNLSGKEDRVISHARNVCSTVTQGK